MVMGFSVCWCGFRLLGVVIYVDGVAGDGVWLRKGASPGGLLVVVDFSSETGLCVMVGVGHSASSDWVSRCGDA